MKLEILRMTQLWNMDKIVDTETEKEGIIAFLDPIFEGNQK